MKDKIQSNFILLTVAIVTIILASFSSWLIYASQKKSIESEFQKQIDERAASIQRELLINVETLQSLTLLFNGNDIPEYARFQKEAQKIRSRHKGIQALDWVPRINNAERTQYETRIREHYPNYEITELNKGNMVKAKIRSEYFPVYYLEPLTGNEAALGFDLASHKERLQALQKSRDSNTPQATPNITLIQGIQNEKGFITFLPIYKEYSPTVSTRRTNLLGFVLGVYKINDIIINSNNNEQYSNINFKLLDETTESKSSVIYNNQAINNAAIDTSMNYRKELPTMWGRKWTIVASPTVNYINDKISNTPFIVFNIALVLTLSILYYIKISTRRSVLKYKKNKQTNKELQRKNQRLELLSRHDALTGIANRRSLNEVFGSEWLRAIRNKKPITFILIDIDFFKKYNDSYGHIMGDECLQKVANALNNIPRRAGDLVARYGGEEFAIVLAETATPESVAHKCCKAIEALDIPHDKSKIADIITISVGVATTIPSYVSDKKHLIEAADKALYQAKEKGRNQVVVSSKKNLELVKTTHSPSYLSDSNAM